VSAPPVSVIIPTRDEAAHIERCIAGVRGLGPVYVVDSGSSDATQALARACGAHVVENAWPGYAAQKNWALDNLPLETEWVLFVDADEIVTPELRDEIARSAAACGVDGFHIPRELVFLGRRLRHAWWYPDYQLRLFRRTRGRFEERLVHEHAVVQGATSRLEHALVHEDVKGLDHFVARHARYAELEAREMLAGGAGEIAPSFLGTRAERRRALKTRVWYRLPFRPAIRFAWLYAVKRGFLDGREGRIYAQLIAAYEAMIDAKLLELQHERTAGSPAREGATA
jgi:glycosyltransferase involved in cell wall biosynthesis